MTRTARLRHDPAHKVELDRRRAAHLEHTHDAPRHEAVASAEDDPSLDTQKQSIEPSTYVPCELPFRESHKSRRPKKTTPEELQAAYAETMRLAAVLCSGRAEHRLKSWRDSCRVDRRRRRGDLFTENLTALELIEEAREFMERSRGAGEDDPERLDEEAPSPDEVALEEIRRDKAAWRFLPAFVADELLWAARMGKLAENVTRCSRFLEAKKCGDCYRVVRREDGRARVYRCGARGCTLCEPVRSVRMLRFLQVVKGVPARSLRFLTLTVPNVSHLMLPEGRATTILSRCFRELRKLLESVPVCYVCRRWCPDPERARRWRTKWKRRLERCRCEEEALDQKKPVPAREGYLEDGSWGEVVGPAPRSHAIKASIRGIEVTFSEKTRWHPHAHVLAAMPWTAQETLADAWTAITRELWPGGAANGMGVNVKNVRDKAGNDARAAGFDHEGALRECLKYPTKVAALIGLPAELAEWVRASRGCRFVQGTGEWAAWQRDLDEAQAEELEDEAPEEQELGPCIECGAEEWRTVAVLVSADEECRELTRHFARASRARSSLGFKHSSVPR